MKPLVYTGYDKIERAATSRRPSFDASMNTLLNRELSWLELNRRVLDLASDPSEPLLERVKFCGIFSSNLDEFFMVRVAGLLDQVIGRVNVRSPDGRTPAQALAEVRQGVLDLCHRQSDLWRNDLCPALGSEGIRVGTLADADEREIAALAGTFERLIFPVLTPLAVGPGQPFPYISGLSLSLGVNVRNPDSGEERFARVKVPEGLPRFVAAGDNGLLVPLEDVISHYLDLLFPGMDVTEQTAFRLTRDGDTEISDDADDLLGAVETELRRRRFGAVVRLEVADSISQPMVDRLVERLSIRPDVVYPVHGMLDLADVMQLCDLDRPDLKNEPWVPRTQRRISSPRDNDLFAEIAAGDVFVQHPYDSFGTSVEAFVRAAANDPQVVTLKTTVYRTSEDSALAPALMQAAENGKQSVCLVELKARFDEQRNIEWARSLEKAGVHVAFGFPDLKIHAKTILVVRREGDRLRRYVHIGTGNYHARTARMYEDVGLFTADPGIAADVADLFNFVTGFGRPQEFRKLLVAPFHMRKKLVEHIRRVATAAENGEHARIRLKLNNLTDPSIIEELYKASQAGTQIDLVVRAICALTPGVPGLSENIRVRSVLGRFLEHSRIYCFESGEDRTYLMGSADMMTRNLDHRIEILVPVETALARNEVETILKSLLADNTNAWELAADGTWTRVMQPKGERRKTAQSMAMRRRARSRRTTPR